MNAVTSASEYAIELRDLRKSFGKTEIIRGAKPMRLISYGFLPSMRWPFSSTSPLEGVRRPLIRLNSVDLPAPLGPASPTISPRRSSKSSGPATGPA